MEKEGQSVGQRDATAEETEEIQGMKMEEESQNQGLWVASRSWEQS